MAILSPNSGLETESIVVLGLKILRLVMHMGWALFYVLRLKQNRILHLKSVKKMIYNIESNLNSNTIKAKISSAG